MQLGKLTLAIAAALAVTAVGVAYAAIPDSAGVISACINNKGALKVIDAEGGQSCPDGQQLLTWNQQGPAGPTGPAGSARAHAEINYSGSVDGGNLTDANVVKNGTGEYCFGGLDFTPQTAIVTLGTQSTIPGTPDVRVRLDLDSFCPIGFRQALVTLFNPDTGTHDDEDFFIVLN